MEENSETSEFERQKRASNELKKEGARASCSVSGTMYLMLRVSRMFGLAPVRFERRLSGLRVRISPALCRLYFFIVTVINVGTFIGLMLDLSVPYKGSGKDENPTCWFIWVATFIVMLVQASIAVYRAPMRLEGVIKCLDLVNKVGIESSYAKKKSENKRRCAFIVVITVTVLILVISDYFDFVIEITNRGVSSHVVGMYSCQYIAMLIIQIMEIQFIITGMEVQSALVAYNDVLEKVISLIKEQGKDAVIPSNVVTKVASNSFGCIVDNKLYGNVKGSIMLDFSFDYASCIITYNGKIVFRNKLTVIKISDLSKPHEMLRLLHMKHFQLCGVVRSLSDLFGPEVLSVLASCMMRLISSPNFILMYLYYDTEHTISLVLEASWVMWYLLCTFAMVEHGHSAQAQMQRTTKLVNDLVLVKADELLQDEVRKFSAFLTLNKVAYTPMDACTLNRSLAVSILGSVATYLIIIYQFQQQEDHKKLGDVQTT